MRSLTTRDKIAHLLRRFGMGATQPELDRLEPFGVAGTAEWLFNYEKVDEQFPVSPWQASFEEGKDEVYVDAYRFAAWWGLRLVMSHRPFQQRLALFWHNHFAISAAKVEFGPMMLEYLDVLRGHATDFPTLLRAVSLCPAMLRFLDGDTNVKGHPNENFAREVLELFTFGEGNYKESDIQELARCFTGWGIRYLIYEDGGEHVQQRIGEAVRGGKPMAVACYSPALFDDGAKSFLGQTGSFTGDQALAFLALHPLTARHITAKLWDHFASSPLPAPTHDRLIQAFSSSQGDIVAVVRQIAAEEAFWSDECIRARIKSPAEYVVPIVRQLDVEAFLLAAYGTNPPVTRPMPKTLRDVGGLVLGSMMQEGMLLFFPPDVGGWKWGSAWITPGNMIARTNLANLLCGIGQPDHPVATLIVTRLMAANPTNEASAVDHLCLLFDAELPDAKKAVLTKSLTNAGGLNALKDPAKVSESLASVLRLLFGSPEFQMC